jgi:hypothetical protein
MVEQTAAVDPHGTHPRQALEPRAGLANAERRGREQVVAPGRSDPNIGERVLFVRRVFKVMQQIAVRALDRDAAEHRDRARGGGRDRSAAPSPPHAGSRS